MTTEERAHAILSASSSARWLACPPSARLNDAVQDESSIYAQEGTKAHLLGELALATRCDTEDIEGDYSSEMRHYVQEYVDYVRATRGELLVEQRFTMERWVEGAFGTADAVILDNGICHVKDFKYGKSPNGRVEAYENSQLKLYALGAYDAFDAIYGPIETFVLHICQPRLNHFVSWEISTAALLAWGEAIRPTAKLAFAGCGDFKSGDHCTYCKVRHTCRTRADDILKAVGDMPKGTELTHEELGALYPKLPEIVRWANDLQDYTQARAEAGQTFAGLKLVEGRSNRTFVEDEHRVVAKFKELGINPDALYSRKLLGITQAEALVGKKSFALAFGDLVVRASGKPTLVPLGDRREAISTNEAALKELLAA